MNLLFFFFFFFRLAGEWEGQWTIVYYILYNCLNLSHKLQCYKKDFRPWEKLQEHTRKDIVFFTRVDTANQLLTRAQLDITRREIPYLCAPMYYSLFLFLSLLSFFQAFGCTVTFATTMCLTCIVLKTIILAICFIATLILVLAWE